MKDNPSSLTLNLASFAELEQFLEARRGSSTAKAAMNSEECEASVRRMAHEIENEINAEELARNDVSVPEIVVEGKVCTHLSWPDR
jgi:hypothetical protein